ncbi:MAG: single-stranded DNA-binding protein [Eubacterium sp.]|jgi:single-strand DNA-binding protein
MLNDIKVMGRLTKDPELRQTQNGTAVAGFTLAVDRDYRDQQGNRPTDFFDIVCWKGTAELAGKYLTKGRLIVVSGRLETRDYNDKNGNKRRAYEIICQNFYFGDSAKGQQSKQHPPQQEPAQPQYKQPTAFDNLGTQVPFDEEVPF